MLVKIFMALFRCGGGNNSSKNSLKLIAYFANARASSNRQNTLINKNEYYAYLPPNLYDSDYISIDEDSRCICKKTFTAIINLNGIASHYPGGSLETDFWYPALPQSEFNWVGIGQTDNPENLIIKVSAEGSGVGKDSKLGGPYDQVLEWTFEKGQAFGFNTVGRDAASGNQGACCIYIKGE